MILKAFEGKINGKRPGDRPRRRWIDRINDDLNESSQKITVENIIDSQIEKCSIDGKSSSSPV